MTRDKTFKTKQKKREEWHRERKRGTTGTKGEMSEGKEEKERRTDSPPSSGRTPSHLKSVARVPKWFTPRRALKRHPFVMPTVSALS